MVQPQIMQRLARRWEGIPEPGESARELVAAGKAPQGDGSDVD